MGTTRMAYKWLGDQSGDQSPVSKLNDADEHEKFNSVTFFALKGQGNRARGFNLWSGGHLPLLALKGRWGAQGARRETFRRPFRAENWGLVPRG